MDLLRLQIERDIQFQIDKCNKIKEAHKNNPKYRLVKQGSSYRIEQFHYDYGQGYYKPIDNIIYGDIYLAERAFEDLTAEIEVIKTSS